MKVGDLVKLKHKYSYNEIKIGIILKVKENFFKTYNDYFQDRLIIHWIHGETTLEPDSYVEKISGGNTPERVEEQIEWLKKVAEEEE